MLPIIDSFSFFKKAYDLLKIADFLITKNNHNNIDSNTDISNDSNSNGDNNNKVNT